MKHWERLFCWSAVLILMFTAAAKLFSTTGQAPVLEFPDPLLGLANRQVLALTAGFELLVVLGLMAPIGARLKYLFLGWLSTNFLIYRLASLSLDPGKPCPCLGTLTERLHLSPGTTSVLLWSIVLYLLVGSLGTLIRGRIRTVGR